MILSGGDREQFALSVIEEVRRWPGVELRPHASPTTQGEADGVEFRLYGRQIGHVHGDCSVHLALTKALKASVVKEQLAEPLAFAPTSGWAMFQPMSPEDAARAIWLLRLNYVRLRRQRLTPSAASSSEVLQQHEAALADISPKAVELVKRTQARSRPRPFPTLDA
ncbi:MAG TPA: luciferase family protein [Gemmatimonadaceae bacterium]